ncbi:MAG: DNA-binding protein [Lachnospiraceae bacterium]|nr:DNA-binding protein [Lachnospiraceae bacterium]
MERIAYQNLLYDFYGELLTDHQRRIYESAVYEDLSLKELSDEYGITRQGVHDLIKRCDKVLIEYENRLHMIEKFDKIKGLVGQIREAASEEDGNGDRIKSLCDSLLETL